jgi:hypothetical protein
MSAYRAALAFGAALLTAAPALAQQAADHSGHHPDAAAPSQAQATTPATQQGGMMCHEMMGRMAGMMGQGQGMMGQSQGMMGQGMMGQGMMGQGMMGGRMAGDQVAGGGAMMGGMAERHVEGRLAFLKAELKITDAQAAQWAAFADVVRANAKAAAETRHSTVPGQAVSGTLPERLAQQEKALTANVTGFKKVEDALGKLYAGLSAEQKQRADGIVIGPMGMPTGMM